MEEGGLNRVQKTVRQENEVWECASTTVFMEISLAIYMYIKGAWSVSKNIVNILMYWNSLGDKIIPCVNVSFSSLLF